MVWEAFPVFESQSVSIVSRPFFFTSKVHTTKLHHILNIFLNTPEFLLHTNTWTGHYDYISAPTLYTHDKWGWIPSHSICKFPDFMWRNRENELIIDYQILSIIQNSTCTSLITDTFFGMLLIIGEDLTLYP